MKKAAKTLFLSHAHLDSHAAIFLQKALEESFRPNLSVFCTSLPRYRFTAESAAKIAPNLREKLALADLVIVLASESSKGSPWVQFETILTISNTLILGGSLGPVGEFSLYERLGIHHRLREEDSFSFNNFVGTVADSTMALDDSWSKLGERLMDKVEFPKMHSAESHTPPVRYRTGSESHINDVLGTCGTEYIRAEYPDITKPSGLKIFWKWIELWLEIEPAGVLDFPDIAKKLTELSSRANKDTH